ncbi:hypothetical protein TNCV_3694211 [Trichonephila clavipes]|nr:hypothetical protein TNCV_3694211 [Trichonephila clavipes]
MTQNIVDPHLHSGYGMEARFANHMPSILTEEHRERSMRGMGRLALPLRFLTETFRDVKIHASKLRLLACRRSSNCNDLLPNMKTQRSAMSLKILLPDTGLRVLRTQVPE